MIGMGMADSGEALVSVRNLKTHFATSDGLVRAVDGVSFDIHSGTTLGVVGESGCGKSVTARSILRIVERPGRIVDGEIWLLKTDASGESQQIDLVALPDESAELRAIRGNDIGLIFQEPMSSLSPVHTIGNQIVEAIRLHNRVSKQEARTRAIDLLASVGIPRAERRIDEYPHQLSGGLRQRAVMAMALSCDPQLLIADEPTTALDVTTQAQVLDLLQQLKEERQMAIMLITHDLGVIAEMADEVVVMYLGLIAEQGPVDGIFHNARHPYTRALLESIPSVESEPRLKLPSIAGSIPHPYNRPGGCPFHPRCRDYMQGTCEVREPRMVSLGDGQSASCFLYEGA